MPSVVAPCIDYLHTGIIKGKWLPQIEDVFDKNGISVDFTKRGFYKSKNALLRQIETGNPLLHQPGYFIKQLLGKSK